MLLRKARLSLIAILFLIALRFVVGFHFYMEGLAKVKDGNFSSSGFLTAAKGPFADQFHSLIPDYDGKFRLPEFRDPPLSPDQKPPKDDPDRVLTNQELFEFLDGYVNDAGGLYSFTEEQKTEAAAQLAESKDRINAVVDQWTSQITEYINAFDRIAKNKTDEMRNNVAGLRKQKDEIESKWRGLVKPALNDIDKILADLESGITKLATPEQIGEKEKRFAALKLPGTGPIEVKLVDKYIPIFDMVVGILLMIGLLTPLAGLAAGLFLASVVLTQFPGAVGSQPTYYQAIEMLACFLLAFSDAGRYAGLDFIPWSFWNRKSRVLEERPAVA